MENEILMKMNEMIEKLNNRFDAVEKRFDAVDKRFDEVDKRFDEVDKRFAEQDRRFAKQDKRFAEQDRRFAKQDKRFAEQDNRFDKQENHLLNVIKDSEQRLMAEIQKTNQRLNQHEQHLKTIREMTVKNTENLTAFRTETNERFDKLELTTYKMQSNIEFLYQETLIHKQDISQLKSQ